MDKKDLIDNILNTFNILIGSGVVFNYSDENIQFKTILEIIEIDKENVLLLLDDDEKYIVTLKDFKKFHVKENINLYDTEDVRYFDKLLNNLIEE